MDAQKEEEKLIDIGRFLRIDPNRQTLLPCIMIFVVVVNKSISMDVLEIHLISYSTLAAVLLSFVFMLYLYFRKGTMSRFVLLTIIFAMLMMTSTFINGTDLKTCFYDVCSLVFVAMTCDYYKNRFHMLIVAFAIAFSICTYLNLIHLLTHPELWIIDDLKTNKGYLLGGNYNGMGCRLLCAIGLSIICIKYSKWWLFHVVPVAIVSIITLYIVGSMTALTGVLLLIAFCLIPSCKLLKMGIISLLVIVFIFQVLVCFQGKGIEQNPLAVYFVEDILGKDITFTNRTYLWDAAAKIFVDSPIYGYGCVDSNWYYSRMSSMAMGTHNYIWGILVTGGALLLAVFTCICFLSFSKFLTTTDRYALLIYAIAAVLFLMMLMENYPHFFILTLIFLASYATRQNNVKENVKPAR